MNPADPNWIVGGRQYNVTTWALRFVFAFSCLCLVAVVFSDGDAERMDALVRVAMYLAGVASVAIGGFTGKNMIEGLRKDEPED